MSRTERLRLEEAVSQADRDLEELAVQVADGEIDAVTAARLREAYHR
ncbi:MAG: hypothetical protein GWN85_39505, partial [Gemmatimonadetes bacterium]|nr:hypothetical protein [Gemmatimonadota bacterium]NIR41435.1 hypothetical protein [Actinomycetota bacterium]NIS36454.1 hypothetical protein [Actinomycetota bacterium]NIU70963.1 hypothetical protein [Actinomycetota bacterium]NIW32905.1 hypothetical protein [Actinomycetota bacterium]